jgi:hypothetical protein
MAGQDAEQIAVADASVLIVFSLVGRLDLLEQLFTRLYVPHAVWGEVTAPGESKPGVEEIVALDGRFIERRAVQDRDRVDELQADVNPGEAEAIALAEELPGALLLIDERRARALARRAGLQLRGTLGLFLEAKRRGLVPAVRPLIEAMLASGFRLDIALVDQVLRDAGEV